MGIVALALWMLPPDAGPVVGQESGEEDEDAEEEGRGPSLFRPRLLGHPGVLDAHTHLHTGPAAHAHLHTRAHAYGHTRAHAYGHARARPAHVHAHAEAAGRVRHHLAQRRRPDSQLRLDLAPIPVHRVVVDSAAKIGDTERVLYYLQEHDEVEYGQRIIQQREPGVLVHGERDGLRRR